LHKEQIECRISTTEKVFLIGSVSSFACALVLYLFCWRIKKNYNSQKIQNWAFEHQKEINDNVNYGLDNHNRNICRLVNTGFFTAIYNAAALSTLVFACILPFQIKYRINTYQKKQQKYNDLRSIENTWEKWWDDMINEIRQD